jgi:hypothetical protein
MLQEDYIERNQKQSIKKMVTSLQSFSPENGDTPYTLVKDILLYLIKKKKYKKYQGDDWFTLLSSMHQFMQSQENAEDPILTQ